MRPLLNGFADELLKLAVYDAGAPPAALKTPSWKSAPSDPTKPPRASNSFGPTSTFSQAIPVQPMESPSSLSKETWRKSPTFTPSAKAPPDTTEAVVGGGKKAKGGGDVMRDRKAFETGGAYMRRKLEQNDPSFGKKVRNADAGDDLSKPWVPMPAKPKPSINTYTPGIINRGREQQYRTNTHRDPELKKLTSGGRMSFD